jgi:hypothetical protein
MQVHTLYSNKQFGFISGRSTVLQLLKVLDRWTEILDEGGCIDKMLLSSLNIVVYCRVLVTCRLLSCLVFSQSFQHLYSKCLATVLQLLKVLDRWTEILHEGGCIDVAYCDFMKAFDKVPHRRLLTMQVKLIGLLLPAYL